MHARLFTPEGKILVSKRRFPRLYAALDRGLEAWRKYHHDWERVAELRAKGRGDTADRIARRLLGVQGPPMSDEDKARLRQYAVDHADEIRERREQKKRLRRRTMELLKKAPKRLTRKGARR